ncbi:MAG TPA: PhzF family isomerase [Bacteroidales bacterium]|nr:PhzF family isomerase [Bacteroidales bacterium]
MKKLIIYQVDSFTKEKFKGNPAGVVLNAGGLSDNQMQSIARELNNSETAFLFPPDDNSCDGMIRYFTPKMEVPTCGHATIGAMYAMAMENNLESCTLRYKTRIGVLPFEIIKRNNDYSVIMTQGKFELGNPLEHEFVKRLTGALRISDGDLMPACPVQIASTGHSKVMICIRSKELLNNLEPAYSELAELSRQISCNGFFVFTLDSPDKKILTHGRMFAPAIGINEDPVTGNANGPLGGYLIQNRIVTPDAELFEFTGRQGEAIGRTGDIHVSVKTKDGIPVLTRIGGEAVAVFRTEIVL